MWERWRDSGRNLGQGESLIKAADQGKTGGTGRSTDQEDSRRRDFVLFFISFCFLHFHIRVSLYLKKRHVWSRQLPRCSDARVGITTIPK